MTACNLNNYTIIYAGTGSKWVISGFSGAPVTGPGLGLGWVLGRDLRPKMGYAEA